MNVQVLKNSKLGLKTHFYNFLGKEEKLQVQEKSMLPEKWCKSVAVDNGVQCAQKETIAIVK